MKRLAKGFCCLMALCMFTIALPDECPAEPVLGSSYPLPYINNNETGLSRTGIIWAHVTQRAIVAWVEKLTKRGLETNYIRVAGIAYDGTVEGVVNLARSKDAYGLEIQFNPPFILRGRRFTPGFQSLRAAGRPEKPPSEAGRQ